MAQPSKSTNSVGYVSVARDFSRFPGPRFIRQGEFSGEAFRKVLVRALEQFDTVEVDLDGTTGMGSSFIAEAFGGLISRAGFPRSEIQRRVTVRSNDDESYVLQFNDAVAHAVPAE